MCFLALRGSLLHPEAVHPFSILVMFGAYSVMKLHCWGASWPARVEGLGLCSSASLAFRITFRNQVLGYKWRLKFVEDSQAVHIASLVGGTPGAALFRVWGRVQGFTSTPRLAKLRVLGLGI